MVKKRDLENVARIARAEVITPAGFEWLAVECKDLAHDANGLKAMNAGAVVQDIYLKLGIIFTELGKLQQKVSN